MEASSVFAAFDTDGDGKVSASELRRSLASTLGEDVSEEDAAAILAGVDADGDGLLNQEEFSRLTVGADESGDDVVKGRCLMEAFGIYASSPTEDAATTMITPASLRRTLSRLGSHELGVEECRAMICRFDLDESRLGPHPFPIYSERRRFWANPCVPARRRRFVGFLALRRPLRRREDGESTDPGVYIA